LLGRSNVGKSSLLNALTQNKRMAKISKTPGRTQLMNFFTLEQECKLVDLPGYGFAKVPQRIRAHWNKTLSTFIAERQCLRGFVLIMDIRHPLTELDEQMLQWLANRELDTYIVLNKSDKLSKQKALLAEKQVRESISAMWPHLPFNLQSFSSTKKQGVDLLKAEISRLFGVNNQQV
jgi:GTP-binding protein